MQVNLFNSLNPNGKRVPVTITVEKIDEVNSNDGEVIYIISLYSGARALNGLQVTPVFIKDVTESNIQSEIRRGLTEIGNQIDWLTLEQDTHPPVITELLPKRDSDTVPITSNVFIRVIDPFPASFIDSSTMKFYVNEIEVTPEVIVKEKNNEIRLSWIPKKILD